MEKFDSFKKNICGGPKEVTDADILKNLDFYVNKAKQDTEKEEVKYYYQKVKLRKIETKKKIKEPKKIQIEESDDRVIPCKRSGGVLDKYRCQKMGRKNKKTK